MYYRATIENILAYCITVWYMGCSTADRRALQRVINTAEKITGCSLPSLDVIASSRYLSSAKNIIMDPFHPSYQLFDLLPLDGATGHKNHIQTDSGIASFPEL